MPVLKFLKPFTQTTDPLLFNIFRISSLHMASFTYFFLDLSNLYYFIWKIFIFFLNCGNTVVTKNSSTRQKRKRKKVSLIFTINNL